MSDTIIWFDDMNGNAGSAAKGVPKAVIALMAQEVKHQRTHLKDLKRKADDVLRHIELSPTYGLFIRGTSSDIVSTLSADMAYGIEHVGVVRDETLEVRYFRHKASVTKTVSYIGIAGGHYWGAVPAADTISEARHAGSWARMASGQINPEYAEWKKDQKHGPTGTQHPLLVTSIQLKNLVAIIRDKRGVDAWI